MELKITETIGDAIEIQKNVMTVEIADYEIGLRQMLEAEQSTTTTATDNITLTDTSNVIQVIDPGGASRTVTLPAESADNHGFLIFNVADGLNETLEIEDDSAVGIATVYPGGAAWIISNGSAWKSAGLGTTDPVTKQILHWRGLAAVDTLSVADGIDFMVIPYELNGMNLISAHAAVDTVSSSGIPTIQLRNVTDSVDMLSTRITIDENEYTSYTATTAPVIDTSHDDVATGDRIAIDIDVAGTGTKGMVVILVFQTP